MNTRKNYRTAANIIAVLLEKSKGPGKEKLELFAQAETAREAFIEFFQGDNPRFNADKFRDECNTYKYAR